MNRHVLVSSLAAVLTIVAFADAGVGYRYRSARGARAIRRFNFAVSETSPAALRRWTAEDFSGESLSPRRGSRGTRGVAMRNAGGTMSSFLAVQSSPQSSPRRPVGLPEGESAITPPGGGGGGGGSQGLGGGSSSDEQTNGSNPVNANYCFCPQDPPGGGGPGGGDDDDDNTGGDDDDDDDDDGGGGGPPPSVIPEPGSFALWALAGCLLVGVTRRKNGVQ